MTVQEVLSKLNALAAPAENTLVRLWKALEDDFRRDPELKNTDFGSWVLNNVNRKILKIATDNKLDGEIRSLTLTTASRYTSVLAALDVSLGLLLQLFGFKVINSRTCNQSFIELCKSCPELRVEELYQAWAAHPNVMGKTLINDVTRFRRVAHSFDANIAPHVQKLRRKASARETTPSVAGHVESADRKPPSRDASPYSPMPDKSPSPQDLRPSFSNSPEEARRFIHARRSDFSPADLTPSPLAKKATPQSRHSLSTSRPSVQLKAQDPGFSSWQPDSDDDKDESLVSGEAEEEDTYGLGLAQSPCYLPRSDELSSLEERSPGIVDEGGARLAFFERPASVEVTSPVPERSTFMESSPSGHNDDGGLSTITEEPSLVETSASEHNAETPRVVLTNMTIRPSRKRSYSDSIVSNAVDHQQAQPAPTEKKPKLVARQPATPGDAAMHRSAARRAVDLLTVMHGIKTLEDGLCLNDEVVNTIGGRLASDKVGVIDSLSLASKVRTDRHRLLLQPMINRPTVLLFLCHSSHWVLFTWTSRENTLTEYNSMSDGYGCFGDTRVPDFLRWLHDDPDLPITFRKQRCPQQPNAYDCGVYALVFASHIAAGKPLPTAIVGRRERLYFRYCMIAPGDRVLMSTEGESKFRTLRNRVEAAKHLARRRRHFAELLKDGSNELLEWVARKELYQTSQSALAGAFANFHEMHLTAVESATRLESQARDAKRDREELEDLHKALRNVLERDGLAARIQESRSSIKLSESTLGHLAIFRQSSLLIDKDFTNALRGDDTRQLADQTCLAYREACVLILVLNYMVKKSRHNAMNMERDHRAAREKLQGYL